MKMLLIPVPEKLSSMQIEAVYNDAVTTLVNYGLAVHEVQLDYTFDLRGELNSPKYYLALDFANRSLLPVAHTAFIDALKKDRELDT
jgi:hypothetical protein